MARLVTSNDRYDLFELSLLPDHGSTLRDKPARLFQIITGIGIFEIGDREFSYGGSDGLHIIYVPYGVSHSIKEVITPTDLKIYQFRILEDLIP